MQRLLMHYYTSVFESLLPILKRLCKLIKVTDNFQKRCICFNPVQSLVHFYCFSITKGVWEICLKVTVFPSSPNIFFVLIERRGRINMSYPLTTLLKYYQKVFKQLSKIGKTAKINIESVFLFFFVSLRALENSCSSVKQLRLNIPCKPNHPTKKAKNVALLIDAHELGNVGICEHSLDLARVQDRS